MEINKISLRLAFIIVIVVGCKIKTSRVIDVRDKADSLLDKIADGKAYTEFSTKYFPVKQTKVIMYDLNNKCDFASSHRCLQICQRRNWG